MKQRSGKRLILVNCALHAPPLSQSAMHEIGTLIRRLQRGLAVVMPRSRPMPTVGPRCHELRITDPNHEWRLIYRIDEEEIVIAEVFSKTTQETPRQVIATCRQRFNTYDRERQTRRDV